MSGTLLYYDRILLSGDNRMTTSKKPIKVSQAVREAWDELYSCTKPPPLRTTILYRLINSIWTIYGKGFRKSQSTWLCSWHDHKNWWKLFVICTIPMIMDEIMGSSRTKCRKETRFRDRCGCGLQTMLCDFFSEIVPKYSFWNWSPNLVRPKNIRVLKWKEHKHAILKKMSESPCKKILNKHKKAIEKCKKYKN